MTISSFYNGNSYTGKVVYLYWINPQESGLLYMQNTVLACLWSQCSDMESWVYIACVAVASQLWRSPTYNYTLCIDRLGEKLVCYTHKNW